MAAQVSVSTSAQSTAETVGKRRRKDETSGNVGVVWTSEEETALKNEFFAGKSHSELAKIHNRAIRAVELRLAKIAAAEVSDTMTVSMVCAKYRITETMVHREVAKKVKKSQPKPAVVKKTDLITRIIALEKTVELLTNHISVLAEANNGDMKDRSREERISKANQ